MINFYKQANAVEIHMDDTKATFPLGVLYAFANEGDSQTVNLRLLGSRKNIYSFLYTDYEGHGSSAVETVDIIAGLLK